MPLLDASRSWWKAGAECSDGVVNIRSASPTGTAVGSISILVNKCDMGAVTWFEGVEEAAARSKSCNVVQGLSSELCIEWA